MGSMGALRFIGLDYGAAQAGLGLRGLTVTPDQWLQVQVIERAALAAMNEAVE